MNGCFHEANRLTRREAEQVLRDRLAPECLATAAAFVLSQPVEPSKPRRARPCRARPSLSCPAWPGRAAP